MTLSKQFDPRKLGSIFNDDTSNMCFGNAEGGCTQEQYKKTVLTLLQSGRPGVFAFDAGQMDPVWYRSEVATYHSKYYEPVCATLAAIDFVSPETARTINEMVDAFAAEDTDILQLSIEACRQEDVPIVVSYRMGAEDHYHMELELCDFGRTHRHLAIPGASVLDPAHIEVYMHRLDMFREVAEEFDIDGIELNFRRTYHMVSNPLHNYPVLTRMVGDVRRVLDDAAARKGRSRMILGARVGPMLDGAYSVKDFPGGYDDSNKIIGRNAMSWPPFNSIVEQSCRDLGLDVKNWIDRGYVDYLSPTLFNASLPGLPRIQEFVELAQGKPVGIYPTLFAAFPNLEAPGNLKRRSPIEPTDKDRMRIYKNELCSAALKMYEQGADGISTFNWWPHHQPGMVTNPDYMGSSAGFGANKVLMKVLSVIGDRTMLEDYAKSESVL